MNHSGIRKTPKSRDDMVLNVSIADNLAKNLKFKFGTFFYQQPVARTKQVQYVLNIFKETEKVEVKTSVVTSLIE